MELYEDTPEYVELLAALAGLDLTEETKNRIRHEHRSFAEKMSHDREDTPPPG